MKFDGDENMKVWITKFALSTGIYEIEAKVVDNTDGKIVEQIARTGDRYNRLEWHETKELAIKRAEEMRAMKIDSLQKQIKKFEAMKFE